MCYMILMAFYINGVELKPNVNQTVDQLCARIDNVYTEERLNDCEFDISLDEECRQLWLDLTFSKDWKHRNIREEVIISKIELIKMPTETNTTTTISWVKNCAKWVRSFHLLGSPYEGDEQNFWRLCRLASTIKEIDCPTNLARTRQFIQTSENLKRREFQMRIYEINLWIGEYRGAILRPCANYITRMSEKMSEKEFLAFSNQVEKVVQPNRISRGNLFYESEFKKRMKAKGL